MVERRTQVEGGIPAAEFAARRERLLEVVREASLTGYVLFDPDYIQYLTGFGFLSNERPVIFAQHVGGDMAVLVPEFELQRVRAETAFERIESYPVPRDGTGIDQDKISAFCIPGSAKSLRSCRIEATTSLSAKFMAQP